MQRILLKHIVRTALSITLLMLSAGCGLLEIDVGLHQPGTVTPGIGIGLTQPATPTGVSAPMPATPTGTIEPANTVTPAVPTATAAAPQPITPANAAQVAEIRMLLGHAAAVTGVALSPNGQIPAAVAGTEVVLWRTGDGTLLRTIRGQTDFGLTIALSPDGSLLATGGAAKEGQRVPIQIWRVYDGTLLQTLTGHTGRILGLAFAPDGQLLASSDSDATLRLWRVGDGQATRTLETPASGASHLAFVADGQQLAEVVGSVVRFRQVSDGKLLSEINVFPDVPPAGPAYGIESAAFTRDGQFFATIGMTPLGGTDSTIKVWRVRDGALLWQQTTQTGRAQVVAFAPDGQTLASGGWDRTVRLWQVHDGVLLQTLTGHSEAVISLAFAPDGVTLASGSRDGSVRLWAVVPGTPVVGTPSPGASSTRPLTVTLDGMRMTEFRAGGTRVIGVLVEGDAGSANPGGLYVIDLLTRQRTKIATPTRQVTIQTPTPDTPAPSMPQIGNPWLSGEWAVWVDYPRGLCAGDWTIFAQHLTTGDRREVAHGTLHDPSVAAPLTCLAPDLAFDGTTVVVSRIEGSPDTPVPVMRLYDLANGTNRVLLTAPDIATARLKVTGISGGTVLYERIRFEPVAGAGTTQLGQLFALDLASGKTTAITAAERALAFQPGSGGTSSIWGRTIAYVDRTGSGKESTESLWVYNLDTGKRTNILDRGANFVYVSIGERCVVLAMQIFDAPQPLDAFDLATGRIVSLDPNVPTTERERYTAGRTIVWQTAQGLKAYLY